MPLEAFTWPISCGGVALVAFSLTLYPRLVKRYGSLIVIRMGLLAAVPVTLLLPTSSLFRHSIILQQVTYLSHAQSELQV